MTFVSRTAEIVALYRAPAGPAPVIQNPFASLSVDAYRIELRDAPRVRVFLDHIARAFAYHRPRA